MWTLIALILVVLGLICDITGTYIISRGVRVTREQVQSMTTQKEIIAGRGVDLPDLASALLKQSNDALIGLRLFFGGFVGQAIGAIVAYFSQR